MAKAAKGKKPSGANGIMDVTHPDKSLPSGNSKSVIVSNRPLLKDPMVVPEAAAPEAVGDPSLPIAKTARQADTIAVTAPVSEAEPAAETPAPEAASQAEPDVPETVPAKADKPEPAATTDEPDDGEAKTEESADKTPAKGDKKAQKPDAEAEAQAKHQAAVDKLADSKKYYLPIDTIEKKRSRRFIVLGVLLSLLLIVAWADIALDAGLVQLGSIKPVTHFFSN